MIKNSIIPFAFAEFSKQILVFKGVKVASAVYLSLIRHAKIKSESQSLLELFK